MTATTKRLLGFAGIWLALFVLSTTVLSRAWWIRRINGRWTITTVSDTRDPDFPDAMPTLTTVKLNEENTHQWNLMQLASLYFNGGPGWERA